MNRANGSWALLLCAAALGCGNPAEEGSAGGTTAVRQDAVVQTPDPGALISVSMDSTVGVVLDELPQGMRNRVANELIAKPNAFWKSRAKQQIRLTGYRLVFRPFFYKSNKMQLPIPPEEVWDVALVGTPTRTTIDGHDVVAVDYRFESTLLTDVASPGISEKMLKNVGGTWDEPFSFPVDPELVFQRTGYACMDEADFPYDSVDSEETDTFYDHSCAVEPQLTQHDGCHQTEMPTQSCKQALNANVGRIDTQLHYERLPWSQSKANQVRVNPPTTNSADMEVYLEDFTINRIEYKYFPPNACELQEQCIGAPGWRRVLQFNSSDQNRGKLDLDIGAVDYYLSGTTTLNDQYHIFEFSSCHQHYHFTHYGQFAFDAPGANVTNKQGFCLQSTARAANHEFSPLHNPYAGCDYQGVAAGWLDQYKIGLPCQWVDITDVNTKTQNVTANLSFTSNPDGFLCEGTPVLDAQGNPVFEPTQFTAADGGTVYRPKCNFTSGWDQNNEHSYPVTVTKPGDTYVTKACDRGQIGPLRNCGWKVAKEKLTCTPGASVTVRCEVNGNNPKPQAVRVCERSKALNTSMACIERLALASDVVTGNATRDIEVTCPAARSADETGGQISIFAGAAFPDDEASPVNCTVL